MTAPRPRGQNGKILVFSDSHGSVWEMIRAIEKETPGLVVFLGDGEGDIDEVRSLHPEVTVFAVRGNCDLFSRLPLEIRTAYGGIEFFAAHGHLHGVKRDPRLASLKTAARQTGAAVALYGHTHRARLETDGDLTVMNPGTAGGREATYGVLYKDAAGKLQAEIRRVFPPQES